MDQVSLPVKPYFRIGEVAEILGVETYVLRYWESEFPQLKPVRAPSRQRLYRRGDVQTLLIIKDLLHNQGFTIAGAKKRLQELAQEQKAAAATPAAAPAPAQTAPPAPPTPERTTAPAAPEAAPSPSPDPHLKAEVVDELRSLLKLLS
jgi:DNA-binding transcriptional MerR regulator